jgi:DNA-binding NarL/FixJ family response regulator
MGRPRVLLVVSHPGVGDGLETLLRLERRYEVRRATRLGEATQLARGWPADAAVVDASMLPRDGYAQLGIPALVLAGSEAESKAVSRALDDARGWLPKDALGADLVAAVEHLLTERSGAVAGPVALFGLGALVVVLAALLLYLAWIAIV